MNKVGSLLQSTRESKGLSVDDVAQKTKIQKIYLDAIEQGDFSFFQNQEFYQQVFVGRYADFLGLNKGEVLSDLHDDLTIAEQPKVSEKVEPQIESEIKETKEIVADDEIAENQITADTILDGVKKPSLDEADSQEITQLIEQINQNNSSVLEHEATDEIDDSEVEIEERFNDLGNEPIVSVHDDHVEQNNSILDQIAKINKEATEKNAEKAETIDEPVVTRIDDSYQIDSSPLESTAVIDLTSGIELETVKNQPAAPSEEVPLHKMMQDTLNPNEEVIEQANEVAIPSSSTEDKPKVTVEKPEPTETQPAKDITIAEAAKQQNAMGVDELERKLHTATNMDILNADPNKTAMDLKVAKALGDNKAVMDEATSKKIKKDKIINTLLIVLIIILVLYFIYQIFFA